MSNLGPSRTVLAFGDSLYAGYGMRPEQSFPAALQRELARRGIEADVINAGISGETTAGGAARLRPTLRRLRRNPDLALLGLGANDALRGVAPATTRRNLEAMLSELQEREIPVLITGLRGPGGLVNPYFARYQRLYPEVARQFGAELEPSLMDDVMLRREYLLSDGLHPNPAGAQLMAERVAPRAAAMLKRTRGVPRAA